MFQIIVKDSYEEVSKAAFAVMEKALAKEKPVLGLATGSSPVGLYQEMIRDHQEKGTSYQDVVTFNLDEYIGLPKNHRESYYTFMHKELFDHIDIPESNVHIPVGETEDPEASARAYEEEIKKYQVDLQVLGIGSDGHIAFNEPGCPFDSETHIMDLTEQTRQDNSRFFDGDIDQVPKKAITQGLATIMRAKKIVLIATGKNKAAAVKGMIEGAKTTACPASILQDHDDVVVILDREAASGLREK